MSEAMDRRQGFTLIELLLAIGLTATVGLISFSGLDVISSAAERIKVQSQKLKQVNLAMTVMARDFRQVQPRPIRDSNGDPETAFWGNGRGEEAIAFTRSGWQNPTGTNRSELQRVHYHERDGNLVRESWTVLDQGYDSSSYSSVLFEDISGLQIRFLAALPDDGNQVLDNNTEWQDEWLPEKILSDNAYLPLAISLSFELADWGKIERLYMIAAYWPQNVDFRRWGEGSTSGRTQTGSGRTQAGSGRTQVGSGRSGNRNVRR